MKSIVTTVRRSGTVDIDADCQQREFACAQRNIHKAVFANPIDLTAPVVHNDDTAETGKLGRADYFFERIRG
jgi:hypothetical protein